MSTGAGAGTPTKTVLDVSPSVVVTTTGTDGLTVGALPLAVNCVGEISVVTRTRPSNETTDPAVNPMPSIVSVKPVGMDNGVTAYSAGCHSTVTLALPTATGAGEVVVARTVTTAGLGATDGAVY